MSAWLNPAPYSYFRQGLTGINEQCQFLKEKIKCQGQKVKYQQKDFITGNTHVNYKSSSTLNLINKVIVFKKWVKLTGQCHKFTIFGTHGEVFSHKIFMWDIKALALTVKKLLAKLKFSKIGKNPRSRSQGQKWRYQRKGLLKWNIKALALTVQKLLARFKFQRERRNDRQDKNKSY